MGGRVDDVWMQVGKGVWEGIARWSVCVGTLHDTFVVFLFLFCEGCWIQYAMFTMDDGYFEILHYRITKILGLPI